MKDGKEWDPVKGVWRDPLPVPKALLEIAKRWRESADGLQREIDAGVAIRQSLESKAGRVAVLQACAGEIERFVEERGENLGISSS